MARNQPAISVDFDASQAQAALGIVQGLSATVKTNKYTSAVLEYVHGYLGNAFDEQMDLAVQVSPERLQHVYDWNESGKPGMRLWKHVLKGRGAKREATFTWVASKLPVPTPQERKQMGEHRFELIPDDELDKLSERRYIFAWKAPVMEYNLKVTISPRWSQALFIPTGNADRPFIFSRSQVVLSVPGGNQTTGQFTAHWVEFWNQAAPKLFDEKISSMLEKDLGDVPIGQGARSIRKRNKTIGLMTFADNDYAFESGKEFGAAYVLGKAETYKQANEYIERNW